MEVEIVEAYLMQKRKDESPKGWSIHVFIPEWGMDIRGIRLYKSRSAWSICMTHIQNFDFEEGKIVSFPAISLIDSEKNKDLKDKIKQKSIEFVEKKLKAFKEKKVN